MGKALISWPCILVMRAGCPVPSSGATSEQSGAAELKAGSAQGDALARSATHAPSACHQAEPILVPPVAVCSIPGHRASNEVRLTAPCSWLTHHKASIATAASTPLVLGWALHAGPIRPEDQSMCLPTACGWRGDAGPPALNRQLALRYSPVAASAAAQVTHYRGPQRPRLPVQPQVPYALLCCVSTAGI